MEVKKNSEVDGDKVKSSITIMGLNYVAALALAAFTFGQVNLDEAESTHAETDNKKSFETTEVEPPPPPPEEQQLEIPPVIPEEAPEKENEEEPPEVQIPPPPAPPPAPTGPVTKVVEEVVEFPDVEAGFPGGAAAMMKWIRDNVKYPQTSIEMNEQGRVFLSFVVEKDGSVSNVKVEKGISIDLDKEAKRVIRKMPKWVPGEADGRAVRARCRLPINFQLN